MTQFQVRMGFLDRYEVQVAGGQAHRESWIPAEDMDSFNAAIFGSSEVVKSFATSLGQAGEAE